MGRLKSALADRYAIEHELGAGGMATVYLAEDLKHHRKVAVKVLRPELAAVLGAERFVKEIETTANLQHPNILPLFDSGEADSFLYYVMPFIDGETLRDKLNRETQLGIEEAVKITTEVADALDYAHRNNVIHRDIKPENILLHDGRPMVADFGIALAVSAAAGGRMTETGMSLGTPHYMSPEQATAEKELTNRSDIYSLGCVLYELLTGEPPHTGASAQAIVMKIVTDEARPVTELRKSVPPHVAAATGKALEKLAADRFATAKEFAEALTNPAFTLPTTPGAAVAGAAVSGPWNRLSVGAVALAAILLLATLWGWLRPRLESAKPVSRYSVALPEAEALGSPILPRLALMPDGSGLVYVGQSGQLLLRRRDELRATPIPGTENAFMPFVSPDGSRVGFLTIAPLGLRVVALTGGGPPVTLADPGWVQSIGISWGADEFLYLAGLNGIVRMPSMGESVESVTVSHPTQNEVSHSWPDVLPNGKGAVFTVVRGNDEELFDVAVVDFTTEEHQVLVRGVYARYAASGHLVYTTADGTLMAAPFDQDALALTGEPVAMLGGVRTGLGSGGSEFTLSATGTLMYVAGTAALDPDDVVWVNRDGTAQEIHPGWTGDFSALALSPDGIRLAITVREVSELQIWVKQLDRGPLSRFTFEGRGNTGPAWTPDGRSVSFVSSRGGDADVYLRRADGSGAPEVILDVDRPIIQAFWAPDGDWLVYVVGGNEQADIYAIRPGRDSVPVVVAAMEGVTESPAALSPNGRLLAYVSDQTGRGEVYVRQFPQGDARWQVSGDGGFEPRWAHSGRELFYRNGANEMVAAEVLSDSTWVLGRERVLFSWGSLDNDRWVVAPDDERFLFVRLRDVAGVGELIVVENFFEELKAKVGNQ